MSGAPQFQVKFLAAIPLDRHRSDRFSSQHPLALGHGKTTETSKQRMISPVVFYDQDQPIASKLTRVGYTTIKGRYNLSPRSGFKYKSLRVAHLRRRFAEAQGDSPLGRHGQDGGGARREGTPLPWPFLPLDRHLTFRRLRFRLGRGCSRSLGIGLASGVLLRSFGLLPCGFT